MAKPPDKPKPTKNPPLPAKSVQLDLFTKFLANDVAEVSNSVELWETIPKYFFTPAQVKKLRSEDGSAKPFEWNFEHADTPAMVVVQPAYVKDADGEYKACFPSVTEELVEEALKKILSDQQYAIHRPDMMETWVRFTLRMIQKQLKERGRSRDIAEIKRAIQVMSRCVITYIVNDEVVWEGAILQDLVTVNRKEFTADREAHHIARLPLFVSKSIEKLNYRQFNFDRLLACSDGLSRWIYRRLIHRFKQASLMNTYHFMYSDLKGSGYLQGTVERNNRLKVIAALHELKAQEVITSYETDERRQGRKVVDVKYTVYPAMAFIREQKAANKRSSDGLETANRVRVPLVDKSR